MRTKMLGLPCDFIDYTDAISTVEDWCVKRSKKYIVFLNPHSAVTCRDDQTFRKAVSEAGMILPDGVGMICAARIRGLGRHGRVTGPEFMLRMCDAGRRRGWSHYLFGGTRIVLDRLTKRLQDQYVGINIAGSHAPAFREDVCFIDREAIDEINRASPDIVWVGLGAPKQEKWILHNLKELRCSVVIGVGAAFDFHSGEKPWAPPLLRGGGLEWLFRLLCEPRRMWRRNINSPIFLYHIVLEQLSHRYRHE